jgi:hypothetical protein
MDELPGYPPDAFSGRGVVLVGGSFKYLPSAWLNVHLLRRAGEWRRQGLQL